MRDAGQESIAAFSASPHCFVFTPVISRRIAAALVVHNQSRERLPQYGDRENKSERAKIGVIKGQRAYIFHDALIEHEFRI